MKISQIEAFQVAWAPADNPEQRSAWVRIRCDDGLFGIGEASPMQGGLASLGILARNLAPRLIGADPLDHAVLLDSLLHEFVKLGPEGALTGALAALDIALWDLKGKLFGQPIYKLLGGAWRTALPFYASIGGNGERTVDEVAYRSPSTPTTATRSAARSASGGCSKNSAIGGSKSRSSITMSKRWARWRAGSTLPSRPVSRPIHCRV